MFRLSSDGGTGSLKRLARAQRRNAQLRAECLRQQATLCTSARAPHQRAFVEQLEAAQASRASCAQSVEASAGRAGAGEGAGAGRRPREQLIADCVRLSLLLERTLLPLRNQFTPDSVQRSRSSTDTFLHEFSKAVVH